MGVSMNDVREVIDQALSILRRKPIDGYEIYLSQSSHFIVESKDSKVDSLEASHAQGMAFRILKRGRMGFSYTTCSNPSPSDRPVRVGTTVVQALNSEKDFRGALEQMIEDAVTSSEATSPDPCFDFAPPRRILSLSFPFLMKPWKRFQKRKRSKKQNW